MKKHVCLLLLLGAFTISLFSQSIYTQTYEYDQAGNRISWLNIVLRSDLQEIDSLSEQFRIERDGLSSQLSACKVTVYPNPTAGEVHLTVSNGPEDAHSEIAVFNSAGLLLQTHKVIGNETIPIDLSPYLSGLYLINFQQGEHRQFYKIIKQ